MGHSIQLVKRLYSLGSVELPQVDLRICLEGFRSGNPFSVAMPHVDRVFIGCPEQENMQDVLDKVHKLGLKSVEQLSVSENQGQGNTYILQIYVLKVL